MSTCPSCIAISKHKTTIVDHILWLRIFDFQFSVEESLMLQSLKNIPVLSVQVTYNGT
jgi:hypothetical protein